jgi:hypothetical protein
MGTATRTHIMVNAQVKWAYLSVVDLDNRGLTPLSSHAMPPMPDLIVKLIVDQLALVLQSNRRELGRCLKATSLVSHDWVYPSQRHLFSTIVFHRRRRVNAWCSSIKEGSEGVSKHVRVLRLEAGSLDLPTIKAALPHLTSFTRLEELDIGRVRNAGLHPDINDINHERRPTPLNICDIPLDIQTKFFGSFADSVKRLIWTQDYEQTEWKESGWKTLYTVANFLPHLVDLNISGYYNDIKTLPSDPIHPRLRLSTHYPLPNPHAFDHFRFQELVITATMSDWELITPHSPFLKYCKSHLLVLDVTDWQMTLASHSG